MKRIAAWMTLAACGTQAPSARTSSPLERCLAGGGQLYEQWSTSNLHGAVTSIAAGGSTIVLGSQDGSVKQWSIAGAPDDPSYGPRFADGGPVAEALGFGPDGTLLAGDANGALDRWSLADAQPAGTTAISDQPLASVFATPDGKQLFVGGHVVYANLWSVDSSSASVAGPFKTRLWNVNALALGDGVLATAGDNYGVPAVELRAAADPSSPTSYWQDPTMAGDVRALAFGNSMWLAAGDGFVALLPSDDVSDGPRTTAIVPDHRAVGLTPLGDELFATAGSEGTLRVWRSDTAEQVGSLPIASAIGLAIDGTGSQLFTSGADGLLHAFGCR
ncbi:MAG TPA: hypothetical protein VMJ10_31410 [Kofleriaceae bacterium]|nr:hypothetical protein [Kofleriaceae bacterium]